MSSANVKGKRNNSLNCESGKVASSRDRSAKKQVRPKGEKKPVKNKTKTTKKKTEDDSEEVAANIEDNKTAPKAATFIPNKIERSNSFLLTRKLSEAFRSITGSRDDVNKPDKSSLPDKNEDEKEPQPFKFTRSRSLMSFSYRKSSKKNIRESCLEELCEESERPLAEKEDISTSSTSLAVIPTSDHPKKKRSSFIFNSLKKTFVPSNERRKSINPRWSESLLNLQGIDNMVSYEDLSFINYDKFNSYERRIEEIIASQQVVQPPLEANKCETAVEQRASSDVPVVRRRKKSQNNPSDRTSCFDTNYERNLDKWKNLYRQSFDNEKLKHMNEVQRNSYRWSRNFEPQLADCLSLEVTVNKKRHLLTTQTPPLRSSSYTGLNVQHQPETLTDKTALKSKSLSHLDALDTVAACQQGTQTNPLNNTVSSSDYISVFFHTETGGQEEELIAPIKGITLAEALSGALKRRNLTLSQITITDNNFHYSSETALESPPYATAVDENTDLELLAGKLLTVTDKECLSKKAGTLQKAASFGARTRPPRLLASVSTDEPVEAEQKIIQGKQLKQRWSGLFGIKNPQQNQLCELLNNYAKNGVPQRTPPSNYGDPNFAMAVEYLENSHKSWRDFVECTNMSENEIKIQTAVWELVTTEIDYIHALQTVTNLFLACLEAIQKENLLNDVDQNKLFSNIRDICEANLKLWAMYLYPMVAQSVSTTAPLCIDFFQPGFVSFATIFAPYKKYCAEQSTCQFYCKELNRTNALFTAYLAWCESQKMCNRLRLADILVRPMQRLTKYSLLLTAIRKHVTDENDSDIMDSMIHSVEDFVCSVNSHLTTRQENERLKGINARIESYDVVDSSNDYLDKFVKQYCTMFDLCSPMKGCSSSQGRHLFMEGDLKFKDNAGKADVHCFLLTDILLVCKTIAKKGQGTLKVIRQPYLTDRLVVKHKENMLYCVYINEFHIVTTAFTLQCSEAKSWHDALCKAKHIYSRLKQGSNWDAYNLRHSNTVSTNNADCLSIKKSPMNSSFGSRVSSLNNSHSGSVELNDSRNISIDFEKTNSLSSDDGSIMSANHSLTTKNKAIATSPLKLQTPSSNQLVVQPLSGLGQSLPNLNLNQSQTSNNTLLVPGTGSNHSGTILLSPSHRGISYPPPSPTRVV